MYKLLKVGHDGEVFLRDQQGNPVPVIGLLGGTKKDPLPVLGGGGYAVQEDNVMAEFNIPPASTAQEFSGSIVKILDYVGNKMKEKQLAIDISPFCTFSPEQLKHPQAQNIGCESDFCVWTRSRNVLSMDHPRLADSRCAGGHVHVSFTYNGKPPKIAQIEPVVAALDLHFLPSLFIDMDTRRRELYGKAGAFRPKEYGVESRILSNFWLKTPILSEWVFNQVKAAFYFVQNDPGFLKKWPNYQPIQEIINKHDLRGAHAYIREYGINFPKGYSA